MRQETGFLCSQESVIGHGLMLLLSIAKLRNLLNSQLPVYDGDRQAPPGLLNWLPEGTDLDPDTLLTHHELMLAFLRRIANASNKPSISPPTHADSSLHITSRTVNQLREEAPCLCRRPVHPRPLEVALCCHCQSYQEKA
jgi:hypothetical protein